MAERESTESVYCLGCGNDLKEIPTERRNLGSDSLATPEPRERVLSSWTSLLNQELQCQGTTIESYIKDPVIQGECVAMEKITTQAQLPPLANCTVTPTRKRNKEGGENSFPARKQMRESSTDTSSPPVTINVAYKSKVKHYALLTPCLHFNEFILLGNAMINRCKYSCSGTTLLYKCSQTITLQANGRATPD